MVGAFGGSFGVVSRGAPEPAAPAGSALAAPAALASTSRATEPFILAAGTFGTRFTGGGKGPDFFEGAFVEAGGPAIGSGLAERC